MATIELRRFLVGSAIYLAAESLQCCGRQYLRQFGQVGTAERAADILS